MTSNIANIEHMVVALMENRSFDNLLGWLYADQNNRPPHNLPAQTNPSFDGLVADHYYNVLQSAGAQKVAASRPTTAWPPHNNPFMVPSPEPGEEFENITRQIFGKADPDATDQPNMSGFLDDYATIADPAVAPQIMQSYSPEQVPIIHQLARNFAVCDRWFASAPCQTWPNRGFVHAGSSDGHINNGDYIPYNIKTIFNVLQEQHISWGVFSDTIYTPSLTRVQFPQIWQFDDNFKSFSQFAELCRSAADADQEQKLPAYSFIEPRFVTEWTLDKTYPGNDCHCTNNVAAGDNFLARIYQAVQASPYRDKILLIITFDEHGGCYDHVPPPAGAVAPEPGASARDGRFTFDRFGVRVPTIVVSSYVEPGTVFRAPGATPYDHTSLLATLRDWQGLASNPHHPFLPSPRIAAAPTLQQVLTRDEANKRRDWPMITPASEDVVEDALEERALNDLQMSLLAGEEAMRSGQEHIGSEGVAKLREKVKTQGALRAYRSQYANPEEPLTLHGIKQIWRRVRHTVAEEVAALRTEVKDRWPI